jgi:hypothetical protein
MYVLGWFQALDNHDYYFVNPAIVGMVILVAALGLLQRTHPQRLNERPFRFIALCVLAFSTVYLVDDMRMRRWTGKPIDKSSLLPTFSDDRYHHWNLTDHWDNTGLLDLEPTMRALGITREDRILVANDRTWQKSLYLVGQRGWNDYTVPMNDSATVDRFIREHNVRYLLVIGSGTMTRPALHLLTNGEVRMFDLRPRV